MTSRSGQTKPTKTKAGRVGETGWGPRKNRIFLAVMCRSARKTRDKSVQRCSKRQLSILRRCSNQKDVTDWNEWRKRHPRLPVFLEGADLEQAHLEEADLVGAYLQAAELDWANMKGARLRRAHLEGAYLSQANLQDTRLTEAHMEGATLGCAHLERAEVCDTHLENADLFRSHLEGARLGGAHLEGTDLRFAVVDGATVIDKCTADKTTDTRAVGLRAGRVEPRLLQYLEYANRYLDWQQWYGEHWWLQWPVRAFWSFSDYGRSTVAIIRVFFLLALLFALAYFMVPKTVHELRPSAYTDVPSWFLFLRSLYFSIVTMTTLGFGDMHASDKAGIVSAIGHILLTIQVLLGYVLLGALVTRFAILFSGSGPCADMSRGKIKSRR